MPYWELYYHIVWSTKNREPIITEELESDLHQYLRGKGISLEGNIRAVGGIEGHVHVAASIPPKISLAKFISDLKGPPPIGSIMFMVICAISVGNGVTVPYRSVREHYPRWCAMS